MDNNNLLLLVLVIVIALFLFFVIFRGVMSGGCGLCPGGDSNEPDNANMFLDVLVKGCLHRLRAVVSQDMAKISETGDFLSSGFNKLVVATNVDPEKLIAAVKNGDGHKLNMVAVSAAVVDNKKKYIVMGVSNGRLTPIGAPTEQVDDAINYMFRAYKQRMGSQAMDGSNLIFYIDEDLPCPVESTKEECCGGGRRF